MLISLPKVLRTPWHFCSNLPSIETAKTVSIHSPLPWNNVENTAGRSLSLVLQANSSYFSGTYIVSRKGKKTIKCQRRNGAAYSKTFNSHFCDNVTSVLRSFIIDWIQKQNNYLGIKSWFYKTSKLLNFLTAKSARIGWVASWYGAEKCDFIKD